ncbi:MAG: methane monooxygenase/ammonia monooxygenase subunit C [Gammaproteobacteria bacterium]|nr:MAG: methane monooxygenase/ammonia monooxygenase subunit C [Gammaproteobacteria bacterium]
MAISISTDNDVQEKVSEEENALPTIPIFYLTLALIGGLIMFGTYRWYQQNYSFTVGLDYFEPEFQIYWMNLMWAQLAVIAIVGAVSVPWLWFTRDKDILSLPAKVELGRYYLIFAVMAMSSVLTLVTLGLFTEADAAWHQVTIRDTDFTPTHIALFYFAIPLMAVGNVLAFIWVHTRLPDYSNRISTPLAVMVAGPILIMPNLGLNEWGHTFFYAEELFAAPIHWGFVTLGWAFFAIGGFILQCLNRVRVLTTLVAEEVIEVPESEAA